MSRMDEFVTYHNGCDGECNGTLLAAWADTKNLETAERFDLSYMYALVYNIPSAIFMMREADAISSDVDRWVDENRRRLMFQSDRRWVAIKRRLNDALREFSSMLRGGEEYMSLVTQGDEIDVTTAIEETQGWYYFSRFAAYLFVETLAAVCHLRQVNSPRFDFEHGDTATSGLMNVFGFDRDADEYDRTGKTRRELRERLDGMLEEACQRISESGGNPSQTCVETSLCAYRKFHKGTRYNGYYLDRQLGELVTYPMLNDDSIDYVNELYELRSELFPHWMLGECRSWDGIRNGMKKFYIRNGRVNGRGDN